MYIHLKNCKFLFNLSKMAEKKHDYYHSISRFVFFGGLFFLLFFFIKKISTVLTPFIIGYIIAYIFSPYCIRMQHKFKIGKNLASGMIVILIQVILILILIIGIPLLYNQIIDLIHLTPKITAFFEAKFLPKIPSFLAEIYVDMIKDIGVNKMFNVSQILKDGDIISKAYTSGVVVINIISTFFLAPILSFYMLRDWGKIHKTCLNLVPVHFKQDFEIIVHEIRKKVSAYISGEMLVIFILTMMYGIGLLFSGLKFGFFIGMLTAIFSIIPYIGFSICFISALLIAFATNMSYTEISIISGIFLFVQVIESNYIIPKLVGKKVELHPLWIIFGLLAGGSILGFLGLVLAIPLTTIISVLIKHYVKKYKTSEYYED